MGCEFFGYSAIFEIQSGGRFAKLPYGVEQWHPAVAISYSRIEKPEGGSIIEIAYESYPKRANYADFTLSNIRFNGDTDGNLNVIIEDDAGTPIDEFTVEYFSSGYAVRGLQLINISCLGV